MSEIPEEISDRWNEFVEMRKNLKTFSADFAELYEELMRLSRGNYDDANEILRRAVKYKRLFPYPLE